MIIHMTGLDTRLVTYVKLHFLTLVNFFYHDISYISFITLFLILVTLLSYITVYHVVIAYNVVMHEHLYLYTHTLIRSLLMTLDSYVQEFGHLLIVQVFV